MSFVQVKAGYLLCKQLVDCSLFHVKYVIEKKNLFQAKWNGSLENSKLAENSHASLILTNVKYIFILHRK